MCPQPQSYIEDEVIFYMVIIIKCLKNKRMEIASYILLWLYNYIEDSDITVDCVTHIYVMI